MTTDLELEASRRAGEGCHRGGPRLRGQWGLRVHAATSFDVVSGLRPGDGKPIQHKPKGEQNHER